MARRRKKIKKRITRKRRLASRRLSRREVRAQARWEKKHPVCMTCGNEFNLRKGKRRPKICARCGYTTAKRDPRALTYGELRDAARRRKHKGKKVRLTPRQRIDRAIALAMRRYRRN